MKYKIIFSSDKCTETKIDYASNLSEVRLSQFVNKKFERCNIYINYNPHSSYYLFEGNWVKIKKTRLPRFNSIVNGNGNILKK